MPQNPYLRTIPLVQHTPLIHFQAGQVGATLRASEVKPRFDRFLWEDLKTAAPSLYQEYGRFLNPDDPRYIPLTTDPKENPKPSAYQMHLSGQAERWYIPVALMSGRNRQPTLNAMAQQYPQAQGRMDLIERSAYFANSDKVKDQKWDQVRVAVMYRNVSLRLTSPHKDLLNLLEEALPYFLVRHNFGTRNNKGFGCFLPAQAPHDLLRQAAPFHFTLKVRPERDDMAFQSLFERLNLLYNSLRSGINVPRDNKTLFYFKSMLFLYFHEKDIQWDKKSIKQTYFNEQDKRHQRRHAATEEGAYPVHFEAPEARLVRDLLGLASAQKWGRDYGNASIEKENSRNAKEDERYIARAKSPLFFKPVRSQDRGSFTVYLGYQPLSDLYRGETFRIQANGRGNLALSLPGQFDLRDFLTFAFSQDLREHVDPQFHSRSEFDDLEDMYLQLHENRP